MYIDIGVNLTSNQFESDREEVINRAISAGVDVMIVTGTNVEVSVQALQLCETHTGVLYSTAGVHPHYASSYSADTRTKLTELLQQPAVVAVGECGLDYFRNFSSAEEQRRCFREQLELAVEQQMPVFLHQRDAHDDFLAIIGDYIRHLPAAVAHCFTGTTEEMLCYLDMGLSIGITGWICDERRGLHLRDSVTQIPIEQLMLETDAPYLLPRTLEPKPKSKRNEPAYITEVTQVVAQCCDLSIEQLAAATSNNARRFFNLPEV